MKNLRKIVLIAIFGSTLFSCDTNEYTPPEFDGMTDIFVRCIKNGEELQYAPVIYAYSNEPLLNAEAFEPEATQPTYQLAEYFEGKRFFRIVPTAEDFSATDLVNGIYEVKITSENNETLTLKDKLLESRIDPMVITEFSYKKDFHEFDVSWEKLDDADVYVVKLTEGIDGKVLYVSERIYKTQHNFSLNSMGWTNFVKTAGTTYVLTVSAYEFETSTATSGYDINSEAVEYREIVW